ncbi:MAG: hypothetical protein Q9191_004946 [Dirinaria sp. TL-2023a]
MISSNATQKETNAVYNHIKPSDLAALLRLQAPPNLSWRSTKTTMSSRAQRGYGNYLRPPRVRFADQIPPSKDLIPPLPIIDNPKVYVLTYASDSELFHMEAPFGNLAICDTLELASTEAHKYIRQELEQQLDNHDPPLRTREQRQEAARKWNIEEGEWVSKLAFETKILVLRVEEWTVAR